MVSGIVLGIFMLITCGITFFKKSLSARVRKIGNLAHKWLGIFVTVFMLIHFALAMPLYRQRPMAMLLLGITMVIFVFAIDIAYVYRNKIGSKWKKYHRIGALLVLFCLALHIGVGIYSLKQYKSQVAAIHISDQSVISQKDGKYIGECNVGYIYAKVEVSVHNHKLKDIKILEHRTERGKKAEKICGAIIKNQKVNVDAVSGATNSSKVIMKAVENALMDK